MQGYGNDLYQHPKQPYMPPPLPPAIPQSQQSYNRPPARGSSYASYYRPPRATAQRPQPQATPYQFPFQYGGQPQNNFAMNSGSPQAALPYNYQPQSMIRASTAQSLNYGYQGYGNDMYDPNNMGMYGLKRRRPMQPYSSMNQYQQQQPAYNLYR
jgi:hypothetical protein